MISNTTTPKDEVKTHTVVIVGGGAAEGLEAALGSNGVTSNYREGMASYTWDMVQNLKQGRALFSHPPMPIKCAGLCAGARSLSWLWLLPTDSGERQDCAGGIWLRWRPAAELPEMD